LGNLVEWEETMSVACPNCKQAVLEGNKEEDVYCPCCNERIHMPPPAWWRTIRPTRTELKLVWVVGVIVVLAVALYLRR
jgi:DNA-directed RNA polymerase subunit RPC12/RpoP